MKVLTPYPGTGEASAGAGVAGGKRARLKGILKPSSHRAGRERRRLDKGKSPISAYYAEHAGATPAAPKRSWSSSDNSAEEEEGYDMSQLQGALPPQSQGFQQNQAGTQRHGAWPSEYPQGPGNLNSGGYARQLSQAALMRERSQSRSRSPSPVFSPDDRIPGLENQHYPTQQQQQQRSGHEPLSRAFPQVRSDSYSNIPLTPNTPLPLLSHHNQDPSSTSFSNASLRPHTPNHHRSASEERRRQLGLTVNTYFEGPPTSAVRVGKKFKPGKKKEEKIVRKPVSEEHGMLRKMFPAS